MTEWRLFPEGEVPYFTTKEFFDKHPWIDPVHQMGYVERTDMAEQEIRKLLLAQPDIKCIVDLGCGDGDLMYRLRDFTGVDFAGFTGGVENVRKATEKGLNVSCHDFVTSPVKYGDLTVLTEVLEHLADPHAFLPTVTSRWLVVTSPSAESNTWHYKDHAWAWDLQGYADLVANSGWKVLSQTECIAAPANHCGEWRQQRFQAITAERA